MRWAHFEADFGRFAAVIDARKDCQTLLFQDRFEPDQRFWHGVAAGNIHHSRGHGFLRFDKTSCSRKESQKLFRERGLSVTRLDPSTALRAGSRGRPSPHLPVPPLPGDHLAQNFFQQFGRHRGRDLRVVLRGIELHDVGAGDVPGDRVDMRQGFPHRHSSRLAMGDPGRKRRVERVHVEGNVKRAIDFHAVKRRQVAHFDDLHAELLRLLALMSGHRADADLDQPLGCALLHDAGKRARMRQPIAFEFVVQIGVGIEMEDGEAGDVGPERAQNGQRNRMVAAQTDRAQALVQQFADFPRDGDERLIKGELQIASIAIRALGA